VDGTAQGLSGLGADPAAGDETLQDCVHSTNSGVGCDVRSAPSVRHGRTPPAVEVARARTSLVDQMPGRDTREGVPHTMPSADTVLQSVMSNSPAAPGAVVHRVRGLLGPAARREAGVLLVLIVIGTLIETLGIGLVMPTIVLF